MKFVNFESDIPLLMKGNDGEKMLNNVGFKILYVYTLGIFPYEIRVAFPGKPAARASSYRTVYNACLGVGGISTEFCQDVFLLLLVP